MTCQVNEIPPITEPMGQYWRQPDRREILLDNTHALMTKTTFEQLLDYSHSQPTGVYPGKMWKKGGPTGWWLHWFGLHENPDLCSGHVRKILLV